MVRVTIPASPDELLALAGKIIAKHAHDATTGGSLLTALPPAEGETSAMEDMTTKLAAANLRHALAHDLSRQADKAYQDRDAVLGIKVSDAGTVRYYVTAVRDLLLALNKGREKALGDWGFEVADTPRTQAEAPAAK